jgi:galactokinase
MDQMACAVGGFVFIDFEDKENPKVEPLGFSLNGAGYSLCIINTGGNHADLNEDYASIPCEMKSVAKDFGKDVLRGLTAEELIARAGQLRAAHGDRAILRAMHFINENERVIASANALKNGNLQDFFRGILSSGQSSFNYLQNVYTTKNVNEQGLSLALCLAEQYIAKKGGAFRVHGGGFAGTIQVFVKNENAGEFCEYMDKTFGEGASMNLRIRPVGACRLF